MPSQLVSFSDGNFNNDVIVDAAISESHNASASTTDYPVEKSFDGTDSVQAKPRQYVVQGVFSNTSLFGNEAKPGEAGDAEVAADRMQQWLLRGALLKVQSAFKTYENMVLIELTVPRSVEIGEAIRFSATFKEIRIVNSRAVTLKKPTPVDPKRPTGPTENKSNVVPEVVNDPETKRRIKESAAVRIGKKAGALGVPK